MQDTDIVDGAHCDFADLARAGKNDWWRYLLSFVSFLAVGFILLLGVFLILQQFTPTNLGGLVLAPGSDFSTPEAIRDALLEFVVLMASLIVFLISARILFPLIHGRPWRTYLTAFGRFRYGDFWRSFLVLAVILTGATLIQFFAFPGSLEVSLQPGAFLFFLPIVLVLTTFQVLTEEVIVRGYLLQAVGLVTRIYLIRLIIPGTLFGLLHLANPEIGAGGNTALAIYILVGLYLTFLVLRSSGLEQAVGFHLANNIFSFSVVGYAAGDFNVPSILYDPSTTIDLLDLGVLAVALFLHFIGMWVWERRNATKPYQVPRTAL